MIQGLALNAAQVAFVVAAAPLFRGVLNRFEERLQGRLGPSIWQPYFDLIKLWQKDEVVSEESTWIFRFAPFMYFVAPLLVTMLIPALTDFPLFWAFMGDMVAAGFILGLGGFFLALAAIDGGNPYGPMGTSRTRMVSSLVEPIFMIVFFSVSFAANSTIPYVVQAHWTTSAAALVSPTHVLIVAAFVMIILAETGRIPVDNPSGHFELAMIDEAKTLEFSGRSAALVKWGSHSKLMVLSLVLVNVLVTPWGLASSPGAGAVALGALLVSIKLLVFIAVVAGIETSLAKLRLFRIENFLGLAFVVAVLAMVVQPFHL